MLSPSGPADASLPGLQPFHDFAETVRLHEYRTSARGLAPSATVEWFVPERALVHFHIDDDTVAFEAADKWEITGLTLFAAFDLQFFLAGKPAFWVALDEPLTSAQVGCHGLVNDTGSRRVSYALLLIEPGVSWHFNYSVSRMRSTSTKNPDSEKKQS
jgi:hypothetical protein